MKILSLTLLLLISGCDKSNPEVDNAATRYVDQLRESVEKAEEAKKKAEAANAAIEQQIEELNLRD